MSQIARLGDSTEGSCVFHGGVSGVITSAASTTLVNGIPVARLGDVVTAACGHVGIISSASSSAYAEGVPIARLGDAVSGTYNATIVSSSNDSFAG